MLKILPGITDWRSPCWTTVLVGVVCGIILTLSACAPRLQDVGPIVDEPRLEDSRIVTGDGAKLPLRRWLPASGAPKAALIALHGFNDYSNAYSDLGPALAEAGIAVYAYDQRGFGAAPNPGLWAGNDALVGDLTTVATLVKKRHPEVEVYAIGESMGGAVIMAALARDALAPIDGVILSAPAVWGRETMGAVSQSLLWFFAHTVPFVRLEPRNVNRTPSDNREMLIALGRDPLFIKKTRIDAIYGLVGLMDEALAGAPALDDDMLILYGDNDQIVTSESTCLMVSRLPDPDAGRAWRLAIYPNGHHLLFRDLEGGRVIKDIGAWLTDPAAPLPSGSEQAVASADDGLEALCAEPES